jgi:GLPGLI family protein
LGWDDERETSDLKISYYTYSFENNKSIFINLIEQKTRIPNNKRGRRRKHWFLILQHKMNIQKQIVEPNFVVEDSIPNTVENNKWTQRNSGYNCRKVGKIFDDVYVFAFYTDDILFLAVHASINGLPGWF